jgi:ADP-ribose pyrophosphatase YjhB (NUDIX family)
MSYIENIRHKVGKMPIILNSAGLILRYPKNKILLVNRIDTDNWGIPGGYMELGESFEQTVLRELHEELNIKIKNLSFLHIFSGKEFYHEYPNGDKVYSVIAMYTSDSYTGNIKVDNSEVKEANFFDIHSLPDKLTLNTKRILDYIYSR